MMLSAARADAGYQGHIVNTASMAGLLNAPNMGVYNVTKHAVVALSETLYQDLRLVTEQVAPRCCALTSCQPASAAATATARVR